MKDKLGIWTSIICLIHCLTFPILATSFPIFLKLDHTFEFILIGLAFIIGCLSFYDNVFKHKYYKSLIIFIISFSIITISILTHIHALNYIGLIGLIFAHYLNYKKIKSVDGCHPHGCKH
jgi:hypothetical protein